MVVSWFTSRRTDNLTFFLGNRQSPWFVVAYGMIGASISGVTFISIPGDVGSTHFSYMVIVFGYLVGYFLIANVLLPVYYRLNLTSIYTYLGQRFGKYSYKTGSSFFLLSRLIGSSFRMFLAVNVLHIFVFSAWGMPFWLTSVIFIIFIWIYTFRSGIKTIVWTDTLQTTFLITAVIITIAVIASRMDMSLAGLFRQVFDSEYSQVFYMEWRHPHFYLKDFLAGAFIAVVMTGLDQDMMQKNLSCKNIRDAKKNVYSLGIALIPVNFLFLSMGAMLYLFSASQGIPVPERTDDLYPVIALNHLGIIASLFFVIGIVSAAYSSADGTLTALTTVLTVDILGIETKKFGSEKQAVRFRYMIHMLISLVVLMVIVLFEAINNASVISQLFTIAGYTYGPLLGLYSFGLFTKYKVKDRWVPVVAVVSPIICYFLSIYDQLLLNGYNFGFELLIINGIFTFSGLWILRRNKITQLTN
jgi:Na+/proline symporter